ncbi:MAG: beta-galactosidase [Phycisphaeraceae bacterium]
MPEVSYDGRSFSIDGRRVWIVSGSIHYARTPRGLWRDRIRAAKQAGLNCIETYVFWNAHEQSPGEFDFEGDLDLRAFVQLIADEGMFCILRPGPYVCSEWDFGGLPAYLHGTADKKGNRPRFRLDEPLYMEAVDRYWRALMSQVGDLQVSTPRDGLKPTPQPGTAPGAAAGGYEHNAGGPIVLVQVENEWFCSNPDQGSAYLERLVSMLRQQGCGVPIVNCNNLWQEVEGTIDTWNGARDLPAMMRQLAQLRPNTPPMVMEYWPGWYDTWGKERGSRVSASQHEYRMAGLIGVGAQFNQYLFHGGTNFGFFAGRTSTNDHAYLTTGYDYDAPLGEAGARGDKYAATKRLCTFASHFGHVLAARDHTPAPAIALNETDHPTALLHQRGGQGEWVVLLKSQKDKTKHTELLLPNGLTLDVPHAGQRTAWVLLNTNLGGVATLDYTSLSPWALADRKLLVVFGPAGAEGVVSINGEHRDVTVPTGKTPIVLKGEPIHVAVLNHEQIDAAYLASDGLLVGCDGLDNDDQPISKPGWGTLHTVTLNGDIKKKRVTQVTKPTAPRLGKWQALTVKPLIDGTDEGYQPIEGPASLGELGQAFGYGWYRFNLSKPATGKVLPHAGGDRLHVYQKGKLTAILGKGEGASDEPTQLKLVGDVVVLADNLGRYCYGQEVGKDTKGLPDHLHHVKPSKAGKPEHIKQHAGDPFAVEGFVYHQQAGARPMAEALAWEIKPESRKPIIVEIDGLEQPCVISVNDEPVRYYAAEFAGRHLRVLLDPADGGPMTGGKNTIKLELLEPLREGVAIDKHVRFYQTTGRATPKDGWAFTPWTIPASDDPAWRVAPKSLPGQPSWLRSTFNVKSTDAPLWLEPHGLSKGQIVLNGHNVGRYWQQTRESKQVGPQQRYYLPEPWLKVDEPNELMLFDEHGRTGEKCRLVYA